MKNISRKRRMIYLLIIAVILFTLLIIRIFWLQFISGDELQTLAYEQQTLDRKVNPRRGTIYDSNMTELAVSSTVYTVTVNPTNIEEKNKELVNFFIMPIMDLDDTTEEKIKKYKNGEMFKNHWLSPYIIPIWNDINLDHVLYDLKLISKLPNDKEKGKVYEELFPKNTGQADLEQVNKLLKYFESTTKTNMNIFIEKCLENLGKFN